MKIFTVTLRIGFGAAIACAVLGFVLRDAGRVGDALSAAHFGVATLCATAALAIAQIFAAIRRRSQTPR